MNKKKLIIIILIIAAVVVAVYISPRLNPGLSPQGGQGGQSPKSTSYYCDVVRLLWCESGTYEFITPHELSSTNPNTAYQVVICVVEDRDGDDFTIAMAAPPPSSSSSISMCRLQGGTKINVNGYGLVDGVGVQ